MRQKKRITLEFGGNAGCIVHSDADLAAAVPTVALGGFAQAGQSCICVQRVVIHESIYDDFRARLVTHIAEKIKTGDPRDRATVVSPMITATVLENVAPELDLCAKEAFAPVVTLHRYRDFDEAVAFVNDSDFRPPAGVFTREGVRYATEEMTELKSLVMKLG